MAKAKVPDKFPVRLNIHMGELTEERAKSLAQSISDTIGAKVYLVPEPQYEESNPKGLRFDYEVRR